MIAIAGGSGSGKTQLARGLVAALGEDLCAYVQHDSYYHCLGDRPPQERAAHNFDEPAALDNQLLAHHLDELGAGRSVAIPTYDFATHTRAGSRELAPRPYLVLDGILLFASEELCRRTHWRVFVTCPAYVRLARRLRRDTVERGRTVDSVLEQYFETVRPMHERHVEPTREQAHQVLSGEDEPATLIAHCRAAIPSH